MNNITIDYKIKVINAVQDKIDKWVGRREYQVHEAIWLRCHSYPYRIKKVIGMMLSSSLEQEIDYNKFSSIWYEGDFDEDVRKLFNDAMSKYLTHVFGG